jgi:outer membrane murein-binding lipoprotein Lpp
MISFRFHVVSITAVFLALAIGVLVGTTYVDGAVVDGLRSRINTVSRNLDDRKATNDRLEAELGETRQYVDASGDFAVTGRLTDVPVLVLAVRGVDEGAAEEMVRLVRAAGGTTPGLVWVESSWAVTDASDRGALAELLGTGAGRPPEDLWATAWSSVVDELSGAAVTPVTAPPPEPSLLASLQVAGFLEIDALGDDSVGVADLVGAAPRVLLVTGARARDEVVRMVPTVARALEQGELPTVLADIHVDAPEAPGRGVTIAEAMGPEVLSTITLVDDADRPEGQVAAVLALDVVILGGGSHYGYGDGASGVLPSWTPP